MAAVRAVYHGHYNVRDQRGHYVKPKTARYQLCHHSCCNGTRVHPETLPVKISRGYLRTLTEPQLERELDTYINFSDTHEQGMVQIIAEIDRREDAEKMRAHRKMLSAQRRQERESEHSDEVYRQWLLAESATNGVMLNNKTLREIKAGKRAYIDERSLFTGPEWRVTKFASPELIEFFESHPRPTRASWFGSAHTRRDHLSSRSIG